MTELPSTTWVAATEVFAAGLRHDTVLGGAACSLVMQPACVTRPVLLLPQERVRLAQVDSCQAARGRGAAPRAPLKELKENEAALTNCPGAPSVSCRLQTPVTCDRHL